MVPLNHAAKSFHPEGQILVDGLSSLLNCIRSGDETFSAKVLEALKAVIYLCLKKKDAKNVLREVKGLDFLRSFVSSTNNPNFIEYGFRALSSAVDQNAANQEILTSIETFYLVHSALTRLDLTVPLLKSVASFTSLVVHHNGKAQGFMEKSGCLDTFITLYQQSFPPSAMGHLSIKNGNADHRMFSMEVWEAINTVLCFAVNEPANELNQERTSILIPFALQVLQYSSFYEAIRSACLFLISLITRNAKNQNLLVDHNGMEVLKTRLEVCVTSMNMSAEKVKVVPEEDLRTVVSLINLIDAAVIDNETNADKAYKVGAVSLVLKLLLTNWLSDENKSSVLLTFAHLIEFSAANAQNLLSGKENLIHFLQSVSQSESEDVLKAVYYIIQLIMPKAHMFGKVESINTGSTLTALSSHKSPSCVTEIAQMRSENSIVSVTEPTEKVMKQKEQDELEETKKERIEYYFRRLHSPNVSFEFLSPEFQKNLTANLPNYKPVLSNRLSKSGKRQVFAKELHALAVELKKRQPGIPKPELNCKTNQKQSLPEPVTSGKSPKSKQALKNEENPVTDVREFVFKDKHILSIVKRTCSNSNSCSCSSDIDHPVSEPPLCESPDGSHKSASSRSCASVPSLLDFAHSDPVATSFQPTKMCTKSEQLCWRKNCNEEVGSKTTDVSRQTGVMKSVNSAGMNPSLRIRLSSHSEHVIEGVTFDPHVHTEEEADLNLSDSVESDKENHAASKMSHCRNHYRFPQNSAVCSGDGGTPLPFSHYAKSSTHHQRYRSVAIQTCLQENCSILKSSDRDLMTYLAHLKTVADENASNVSFCRSCCLNRIKPQLEPGQPGYKNAASQTRFIDSFKGTELSREFCDLDVNPGNGQGPNSLHSLHTDISDTIVKKKKQMPLKELDNEAFFDSPNSGGTPDIEAHSTRSLKRTANYNDRSPCMPLPWQVNGACESSDDEIDVLNCSSNPVPMAKRLALLIRQEKKAGKHLEGHHRLRQKNPNEVSGSETKNVFTKSHTQQKSFLQWIRILW